MDITSAAKTILDNSFAAKFNILKVGSWWEKFFEPPFKKLFENSPARVISKLIENPPEGNSRSGFEYAQIFRPDIAEKWIHDRWAYWKQPLYIHALLQNNVLELAENEKGEWKLKLSAKFPTHLLYYLWDKTQVGINNNVNLKAFLNRFIDSNRDVISHGSVKVSGTKYKYYDVHPAFDNLPDAAKEDLELALSPPPNEELEITIDPPAYFKKRLATPLLKAGLVERTTDPYGIKKYRCLGTPYFLSDAWKIIEPATKIELKDFCKDYIQKNGKPVYNNVQDNAKRKNRSSNDRLPEQVKADYDRLVEFYFNDSR